MLRFVPPLIIVLMSMKREEMFVGVQREEKERRVQVVVPGVREIWDGKVRRMEEVEIRRFMVFSQIV